MLVVLYAAVRSIALTYAKWPHTNLKPQYRSEMRTSRGALQIDSIFFTRNSRRDNVMSAKRLARNVNVARNRPITVRNAKCQPYASLLDCVNRGVDRRRRARLTRDGHSQSGWVFQLAKEWMNGKTRYYNFHEYAKLDSPISCQGLELG